MATALSMNDFRKAPDGRFPVPCTDDYHKLDGRTYVSVFDPDVVEPTALSGFMLVPVSRTARGVVVCSDDELLMVSWDDALLRQVGGEWRPTGKAVADLEPATEADAPTHKNLL